MTTDFSCMELAPLQEESFRGDAILEKVKRRQAQLWRERDEAKELLQLLQGRPTEQQLLLVRNRRDFATWGFCELSLERSWSFRFDNVHQTLTLARIGLAAALRLDETTYGWGLVRDMQARAQAYVANGFKIQSQYDQAEEAYAEAEALLSEGTGDPLEEANLLRMKAALRSAQDQAQPAVALLVRAAGLYRRAGDPHGVGTCLAEQGVALGRLGDFAEAIRLVERGVELMEPEQDLRWYLCARHNLISLLEMAGELTRAIRLLRETTPLYAQLGDRLNLTRLRLLEGKLYMSLGRFDKAEDRFLEARNGFLSQDLGLDAAEVAMELALMYSQQGRLDEIRRLAWEMFPIFETHDLHRHAGAALALFQEAVGKDSLSLGLIEQLRNYLQRARENPDIEF